LRFTIAALALFGSMSQSFAAAKTHKTATSVMICDKADDSALCLNEPQESPQDVILRNETPKAAPSMVTATELSGGALTVENEALLDLAIDPIDTNLRPTNAVTNAQLANDKLRSVELYLKTAAPEGDGIVIGAGKK
ncbi:MAG: hypothetical protein V4760_00640, partial [Bdellovibrionota bacterium]